MQNNTIGSGWLALVLAGLSLVGGSARGDDSSFATAPVVVADTPEVQLVAAPPSDQASPPPVTLSQGATDLARLAQSGIGEDVMLAYVGNAKSKFNLGSDQIVYLSDLGVSGSVVKAMIQRDDTLDATSRAALDNLLNPSTPPIPPPTDSYPPIPPDDGSTQPASPVDDSADNAPVDDADYFYNSLAPYGNWIYVAGSGLCWQPTVYLGNRDWRPYGDRGRWLYSDCGWYWQSDYSWGWAPFHYGRWFCDANRGWVWAPNRVWGPAWVSWRHSADYCGWAPLPPAARFVPGRGFLYANRPVPANFEFGLQASHYTYIPLARLSDYSPARYAVPPWQRGEVHAQTTVINQFAMQNNRVVNHGIDPREVAAVSQTEIRRAEVHEMPRNVNRTFQSEHLAKSGNALVIFHPPLPAPAVHHGVGPGRNMGAPRTSVNEQRSYAPATGTLQPATGPQTYPAGSLVMIGKQNPNNSLPQTPLPNMKIGRQYNGNATAYQTAPVQNQLAPAAGPVAGFNFNGYYARPNFSEQAALQAPPRTAPAQNQTAYVIPGRFTAAQQLYGRSQNEYPAASAYSGQEQTHSDVGATRESRVQAQPVGVGRAEVANSYRAAAAASVERSAPAPASHAAPAASNSSKR